MREFLKKRAGEKVLGFISSIETNDDMANESGLSEFLQDGGKDGRIEISGMAWQHESNCRGEFVEFLLELYVIRVAEVVKRGNAAVLVEIRHDRY